MLLEERTVDLTKIGPEDLFIKKANGGTLYIQLEGNASISLSGKNSELETYVDLPVVNMSTFAKANKIEAAGFYMVVIGGLDQIQMNATGTGKMHWKVMGD